MALSNILREPRREITESVVGLAIFGGLILADYKFGVWLQAEAGYETLSNGLTKYNVPWPAGMYFGLIGIIGIIGVLLLTHALGDAICNSLQRNGIHLRPRRQ